MFKFTKSRTAIAIIISLVLVITYLPGQVLADTENAQEKSRSEETVKPNEQDKDDSTQEKTVIKEEAKTKEKAKKTSKITLSADDDDAISSITGNERTVELSVGDTFKIMQSGLKLDKLSDLPDEDENGDTLYYRIWVKKITTPKGGSYTYYDSTKFDNDEPGEGVISATEDDKNKAYTIVYGVQQSVDKKFRKSTWVPEIQAVTTVKIKGDKVIKEKITEDEVYIKTLDVEVEDGTRPWNTDQNGSGISYNGSTNQGKDSSDENGIVRTFDKITYNLIFNAASVNPINSYKDGYIFVEADLPLTKDQATFDTNSMGFMENGSDVAPRWELKYYDQNDPTVEYDTEESAKLAGLTSDDIGQRLRFYYRLEENVDQQGNIVEPYPCSGAVPVTVNVYRMKNDDIVQPTFHMSVAQEVSDGVLKAPNFVNDDLSDNRYNTLKSITAPETIVTCAPSYNIQIRKAAINSVYNGAIDNFDLSTGNGPVGNNTTGSSGNAPNKKAAGASDRYVYGQMNSFGVSIMLYQKEKDMGLKGVEFPTEPITFNINMRAYFVGQDGTYYNYSATPVLWDAGANESEGQADSPNSGRDVYGNMTGHCYASYAAPRNNYSATARREPDSFTTGTSNTCWNGGKWDVRDNGNGTLSVTVSDFVINPHYFPYFDWGYSGTNKAGWYFNPSIGVDNTNIGVFSAGEFYTIVPHSSRRDGSGSSSNNWANQAGTNGQMHVYYEVNPSTAGYSFNSESDAPFRWQSERDQGNARDNQSLVDLTDEQEAAREQAIEEERNPNNVTPSSGRTVFYSTDNIVAGDWPMLLPGGWNNHIWYTTPDNFMQGIPKTAAEAGLTDQGSMEDNAKAVKAFFKDLFQDRYSYAETNIDNVVSARKKAIEEGTQTDELTLEQIYAQGFAARIGGNSGVGGGAYWDVTGNGDANHVNGSDESVLGNKVGIIFGGFKNTKDGSYVTREQQILKFDNSVLTPLTDDQYRKTHVFLYNRLDSNGDAKYADKDAAAGTNPPGLSVSYQYGHLPGNRNWANQTEMNNATDSDLTWNNNPAGSVAIRGTYTNMARDAASQYQHVWNIAYFQITSNLTSNSHIYGNWALAADKSTSNVNYVAPTVMLANAWQGNNLIVTDYGTGEHTTHGFKQPDASGNSGVRWYEKASYATGAYNGDVKGNTGLYAYDGDSLRLRSFTTVISKQVESKSTYDLSDEEDLIADFKIIPEFNVPSTVNYGNQKEIIVIEDTLPAGATYREGSATFTSGKIDDSGDPVEIEYKALVPDDNDPYASTQELSSGEVGGTYKARSDGKHSRVVANSAGSPAYVEPQVTKLSGDRTKLVWVLEATPGEELPIIHYSIDMQQTTAALNGSDTLVNTVTVRSKTEKESGRSVSSSNGNQANSSIKLKSPRLLMPIKVADQAFTDTDGTLSFSPRWTNMMPSNWKNAVMMDTMPTNDQDYKDYSSYSNYHGSYTVVDGKISFKLPTVNQYLEDYTVYYTTDPKAFAVTSGNYSNGIVENEGTKDEETFENPNKAIIKSGGSEITLYTNIEDAVKNGGKYEFPSGAESITWKKATVSYTDKDSRMCEADFNGETPTAWFIFGTIPGGKPITANVQIKTKGSKNGDIFTNGVSVEGVESSADAYIANRTIEGTVWIDKNYDGIRQDSERLLPGVTVSLYKWNEEKKAFEPYMTDALDSDGYPIVIGLDDNGVEIYKQEHYQEITDQDGHYKFINLAEGNYMIRFTSGSVDLGDYRATISNANDEYIGGTHYDSEDDSDATGYYVNESGENTVGLDHADIADGNTIEVRNNRGDMVSVDDYGNYMIPAAEIKRSPYEVHYRDLGLIERIPPDKEIDGSKTKLIEDDPVKPGDVIPYKIKYVNDWPDKRVDVIIKDVIDKGLTVDKSSISDGGVFTRDATGKTGGTITWTIKDVPAAKDNDPAEPTVGYVYFSAKVNSNAYEEHMVENKASIKIGEDPEVDTEPIDNPAPEKKYTKNTPSGKDQTQVKIGDTIGYEIFWKNTEKEYKIVQVTDGYGIPVLDENGKPITKRVPVLDENGDPVPAKVTVVIKDVIDKGLTVVESSISNGGKYDPKTRTITWNFSTRKEEGSVTFKAKVNSKAKIVSLVKNKANVKVGNHPDQDTNRLVNPVPSKKIAADSPSGKNENQVSVGDKIKYDITYANYSINKDGKKSAAKVTIKDVVDKGLTVDVKSITDGGVYTPDASGKTGGTIIWTFKDVPYGTRGKVSFTGTVNNKASKKNVVKNKAGVTIDNGRKDSIETNETENPVPRKEYAKDTPSGKAQTQVKVGDTIKYRIFWYNPDKDAYGNPKKTTVVITDVIDKGLTVIAGSVSDGGKWVKDGSGRTGGTITWRFKTDKKSGSVTFKAKVNSNAETPGKVENTARVKVGRHPTKKTNTLVNPVPVKKYAEDSPAGKNESKVSVGDVIKYEIDYANYSISKDGEELPVTVTITDVIHPGLTVIRNSLGKYARFTPDKSGKTGGTIVWTIPNVKYGMHGKVTFKAKVNATARRKGRITNTATVDLYNKNMAFPDKQKVGNGVSPDKQINFLWDPVKTGDSENIINWILVMLAAVASAYMIKRKSEEYTL